MKNRNPISHDDIYQLMSKHHFTIINDCSDEFICIICGHILINSHQAPCGCSLCRACLDDYVESGATVCPGDTADCRLADLSLVVPDHRINRQISQLVVQCPQHGCHFSCPLKVMAEHLRWCPLREAACPFAGVSCAGSMQAGHSLDDHMRQASCHHSEILVGIIGNMRNEVAQLQRNEDKLSCDIDQIKRARDAREANR